MLKKDEIQKAMRGPVKLLDVPDWGGEVGIRRLSAADLMHLRTLIKPEEERTPESDLISSVEFLSMVISGENGERLFTADELRELDATQMGRLLAEAQAYNGLTEGAAEAREKNSVSGQTSGST